MTTSRIFTPVAVCVALLAAAHAGAAGQSSADPLPVDPAVVTGRLDNGMRYVIRRNERPERRAELRLVVDAGSILERDDELGLAHMVEHMAFNGTERFEKQALVSYLERIGMRFGADLNAYTSFDETVYMLTVPTDTAEYLPQAFRILADWAGAITFDPAEVEAERGVVIEEWRLGQGAQERLRQQVFPVLFAGSRYADRLPIGTEASLRAADAATLLGFYERWYRPDLMSVIAVGDFDVAEVEGLIRTHLGGIEAATPDGSRPFFDVPAADTTRYVVATDAEATNTTVQLYWLRPVPERGSRAAFRASLVEALFGGMLNARFDEIARRPDAAFIGAAFQSGRLVRTRSTLALFAVAPEGGAPRALEALVTETERARRTGFTETELERARASLLRAYEQAYAERARTSSSTYAAEYVTHVLQEEPIPGIELEWSLARELVPTITLSEVERVAQSLSGDGGRVAVVEAPVGADVPAPSVEELRAALRAGLEGPLTAWVDDVADGELLAPPTPGGIIAERRHGGADVVEWTLSNGARVLLKTTDFKDDEVLFAATSPGGLSRVADADLPSGMLATAAVSAMGLGAQSASQLQKTLAGRTVGVQPGISETAEGVQGAASPKDLETLFQLVHLYFTAPRADSSAFDALRTRLHGLLANQSASPQSVFQDSLMRVLSQHHPRALPFDTTLLARWDMQRSLDVYRERFADAGDFTFVFVGNIAAPTLRPLVERYLASLPARAEDDGWRDVGVRPPDDVVERVVRRGIEPQAMTQFVFSGPFDYDPADRHRLRSLGDVLEIRLRDELRESMGGTYGVAVGVEYADAPWEHYALSLRFGAAPDRLEELADAVLREITRLQTEDIDAELLARVQEMQRRELEQAERQNGWWLATLIARSASGEPLPRMADERSRIDALTAEAIRDAARTYLDRSRYVRVSLVPEAAQ